MSDTKSGWGFLGASRKTHYFVDSRSLCGKWAYAGPLEENRGTNSPDDCAACRRAYAKMRAKFIDSRPNEDAPGTHC